MALQKTIYPRKLTIDVSFRGALYYIHFLKAQPPDGFFIRQGGFFVLRRKGEVNHVTGTGLLLRQ